MLLSLQPGIKQGDPRSVEVGVKVLEYKSKINGYSAPSKLELSGGEKSITIQMLQEAAEAEDGDDT